MKIPKEKTIRGKINDYAYKVGLTIVVENGKYSLFDIHMGYFTHKHVNMDTVVRVVIDELYAREYRKQASLAVGA